MWTVGALALVMAIAGFSQTAIDTKNTVLADGNVAVSYVAEAAESLQEQDFDQATYKFNAAAERFIAADQAVGSLSRGVDSLLAVLPVQTSVTSQAQLLEAGGNLAIAGKYLSRALEPFQSAPDVLEPLKTGVETEREEGVAFTESVAIAAQNLRFAQAKLAEASTNMERVDIEDLPEDIQEDARVLKETLPAVTALVDTAVTQADFLLTFLGHDQRRSYLVMFQNDHELRPTGGFIGTIGLLTIDEGRIQQILVEGPYRYDGQLTDVRTAPEPMRLIEARAYARDMNWFLDFPTSAEQVARYLDKSGAPTVDGVIALNASIMEGLLEITGPVQIEGYDTTVSSDTFYKETQREVEIDYDKEKNRPKEFVGDMIPAILNTAFTSEKTDWPALADLMASSLKEKDVMVWFHDAELQRVVEELGYDGGIPETRRDYLAVVAANVGGGKTDGAIETHVTHDAEIQQDGSVIDTVTITRTHTGDPKDFWEGVKNVSYLRTYVPFGSELLDAEGFDPEFWNAIYPPNHDSKPDEVIESIESTTLIHEPTKTRVQQETGRTTFGNWMGLEAGQSKTVTLRYRLPFTVQPGVDGPTDTYGMYFQRQPAARNVSVESRVRYPTARTAIWQYVTDGELVGFEHSRTYTFDWETDKTYMIVLQ